MSVHDTETRDARQRGVGELVKDLAGQTSTLVRQEIQLAQAEVTQKGKLAGKGAGMLAGAAVFGLLALGALTAALIALLDTWVATWIAALPTPLPAPITRQISPSASFARSTSMCHAVRNTSGIAAASCQSRSMG